MNQKFSHITWSKFRNQNSVFKQHKSFLFSVLVQTLRKHNCHQLITTIDGLHDRVPPSFLHHLTRLQWSAKPLEKWSATEGDETKFEILFSCFFFCTRSLRKSFRKWIPRISIPRAFHISTPSRGGTGLKLIVQKILIASGFNCTRRERKLLTVENHQPWEQMGSAPGQVSDLLA